MVRSGQDGCEQSPTTAIANGASWRQAHSDALPPRPARWPIMSAVQKIRRARPVTASLSLPAFELRSLRWVFHQGYQLTLHGLVLDLAIGPQQSQAERAVEKQKAFDLSRLAVPVVEEGDGHIEGGSDLLKTGGSHAVDALLVFLNLLETDTKLVPELCLRDPLLDAPEPDSLAQFNVGFSGTALLHLLRR